MDSTSKLVGAKPAALDDSREIPMHESSDAFRACILAVILHLDRPTECGLSWLRDHSNPPILEHLSFRMGNLLVFLRLVDVDGIEAFQGTPKGLFSVADDCRSISACVSRRPLVVNSPRSNSLVGP